MSDRLERLRRARPRSRFLRASAALLAALALAPWVSGTVEVGEVFSARRAENLRRFLTQDIVPYPLRGGWDAGGGFGGLWDWARELLTERGLEAMLRTLGIGVVAIVLAGLLSFLFAPLAASNVMRARPFEEGGSAGAGWRLLRGLVRLVLVASRAVPEYMLAFLLLALLGPGHPWPAILALALHNGGILGRLGGETIENLDPGPMRQLVSIGATRRRVLVGAVFPLALGRYLLYFFYRFETCIREATVLGMLGVVSLGYWIQDARAKQFYDEMLLFVLLGAVIVLLADLVSALARRAIRRGV